MATQSTAATPYWKSAGFVLVVLALLTFVRGVLYLAVTPPWQGPDEPGHFEYVALLFRLGRVPKLKPDTESIPELTLAINESARQQRFEVIQAPAVIRSLDEQNPPLLVGPREAGYQTPTYYAMLLPIFWFVSAQAILVQYYALALISVVLGVITVVAAAMAARTWLPHHAWAQLAIPLVVSFWPNQAFMTTRINNDNLVTALAALVFWMVTVLIRHGPRPVPTLVLAGLTLLALYTKGTALFLLPVGVLALVLAIALRSPEQVRVATERALAGLAAIGGMLTLLALLVPRAAAIMLTILLRVSGANRGVAWTAALLGVLATGQQWQAARLSQNAAETLFILRTFWAVFGWAHFFLPAPWYIAAAIAAFLAIAGWIKLLRPSNRKALAWARWQWAVLVVFVVAIPLAVVPLAARMVFQPFTDFWHGRILLSVLVPVAALLALGWYAWIPARWRDGSLQWLAGLLVLVEAASFGLVLLPSFYR